MELGRHPVSPLHDDCKNMLTYLLRYFYAFTPVVANTAHMRECAYNYSLSSHSLRIVLLPNVMLAAF